MHLRHYISIRTDQTARKPRAVGCFEVMSKPSWFEYDDPGYLIALAMICNPM